MIIRQVMKKGPRVRGVERNTKTVFKNLNPLVPPSCQEVALAETEALVKANETLTSRTLSSRILEDYYNNNLCIGGKRHVTGKTIRPSQCNHTQPAGAFQSGKVQWMQSLCGGMPDRCLHAQPGKRKTSHYSSSG